MEDHLIPFKQIHAKNVAIPGGAPPLSETVSYNQQSIWNERLFEKCNEPVEFRLRRRVCRD